MADSVFLKACRGEPVPHTPIWLMRQAGRYMKEYRELRSRVSFLELCRRPELAAEVTVHACQVLGTDAAILFADILLVVESLGLGLDFVKGDGPQITPAVRDAAAIDGLREADPDELSHVYEAVRLIRAELPAETALIGFAGAPFTVASYMIEGGPSRDFEHTKRIMYGDEGAWRALMEKIARATSAYINRQIEAGADAVQLFDSWVGCLDPYDYRRYVMPYSKQVLDALPAGVPRIHFGKGTGLLLEEIREAGGTVVGIDYMTPLDRARQQLGDTPVQGNLDPVLLLTDRKIIEEKARAVLKQAGPVGHIFNLGHGILPPTPVDNVKFLVDLVHEVSACG
ncbi:MAG: uroporphyrinogen decarboxylase [Candidatus Eremiobacteraeota bacterium]|nr:uroporphyrinogen decarboxylase [Candidatus Eremiobacteraeota bacterium]